MDRIQLARYSDAVIAESPTFAHMINTYGIVEASKWIAEFVTLIFVTSSKVDASAARQIKSFSDSFAAEVRPYKISEITLFFARYRSGRYENSMATFDAKKIGMAFFKEFLPQRRAEIQKADSESRKKKNESGRGEYVSRDMYLLIKKASLGDTNAQKEVGLTEEEAKKLLKKPQNED